MIEHIVEGIDHTFALFLIFAHENPLHSDLEPRETNAQYLGSKPAINGWCLREVALPRWWRFAPGRKKGNQHNKTE